MNKEENIETLYEMLRKEAKAVVENSKSAIYLTDPTVLTLVKLKDRSYYCLETDTIGQFWQYKKAYADDALLESFEIGKENNNGRN